MMKKIQTFNYKKGETTIKFEFDVNRPEHKEDIDNFLKILDEAKKEVSDYYSSLK